MRLSVPILFGIFFPYFCFAQIQNVNFTLGSSESNGWVNLIGEDYGGSYPASVYGRFPGTLNWTNSIPSNVNGSGDVKLRRISGSPGYPAAGGPFPFITGMYFGSYQLTTNGFGGTLSLVETSPVAGLKTILLQIQTGEVLGHDFFDPSGYPVLKINSSSNGFPPSFPRLMTGRYTNGVFANPINGKDEPKIYNTWVFQWNFTNSTQVDSFSIDFSCVTHAQIYSVQLDQTSALQPAQISFISSTPPEIRLLDIGEPLFNEVSNTTSVTHAFDGPTNRVVDLEFSSNLTSSAWSTQNSLFTGAGIFTNTFSAPGDLRDAWRGRMFFRARFSQYTNQ